MFLPGSFKCYALSFATSPHNRHVQKGGGGDTGGIWGLKPLPFFKIIQKCPSQTNRNDIIVNKSKCILNIINMTMCTKW